MGSTRECTRCRRDLPISVFPIQKHLGGRLNPRCRECLAAVAKEWKDRNKAKVAETNRKFYHSGKYRAYLERDPRRSLLRAARNRALVRGIPFTISLADVVVPPTCPVFGMPLKPHFGSSGGRPDSPSLDRIIPALGYIPGNVRVISHLANSMKGNATPEQLMAFARHVLANA